MRRPMTTMQRRGGKDNGEESDEILRCEEGFCEESVRKTRRGALSHEQALKPSSPKVLSPKVLPGELVTLLDLMRYGVSRFVEAGVVFAHGTTDPVAEAAFIVAKSCTCIPTSSRCSPTRVTA